MCTSLYHSISLSYLLPLNHDSGHYLHVQSKLLQLSLNSPYKTPFGKIIGNLKVFIIKALIKE